jgi:hypothetical protein
MKKFLTIIFIFISSLLYAQTTKQKDYYNIFRCDTVDTEIVEEYFITQLSNHLGVEYLVIEFKSNSNFEISNVEYMKKGSEIKYRSTIELAEYFLGKEN